jgi:CheY-like chemotaxis protein
MEYRYQPFANLIGTRVLLVSTSYENIAFYGSQLGSLLMDVTTCRNFSEAAKHIEITIPSVVIINPDEDDFPFAHDLVKHVSEFYPSVPVIALTKTMPEVYLDAIMSTGASVAHINRSMSQPRDLMLTIEHMLGKK